MSLLTDAQAQQLEPLRAGLEPLFDQLALGGLPRTKVVQAWAFTTQSTVTTLSQLHAVPFSPPASTQVPSVPLWVLAIPAPAGVPDHRRGPWYIGEIVDIFLLTDPRGTSRPVRTPRDAEHAVRDERARPAPAGGDRIPVSLFGHGLHADPHRRIRHVRSLATAGQVMVAIDEPWHGERNTCTGFGELPRSGWRSGRPVAQDLFACVNPAPGTGTPAADVQCRRALPVGRPQRRRWPAPPPRPGMADQDKVCILAGQGHCAPDESARTARSRPFASGPGSTVIPVNGWNLLNLSNFFATRDNFRQQVVSNAQLARVLGAPPRRQPRTAGRRNHPRMRRRSATPARASAASSERSTPRWRPRSRTPRSTCPEGT